MSGIRLRMNSEAVVDNETALLIQQDRVNWTAIATFSVVRTVLIPQSLEATGFILSTG
jgi:hypothetical protein